MIPRKRSAPGLAVAGAAMNPRLAADYHLLANVQLPSGLCSLVPGKGRLAPGVGAVAHAWHAGCPGSPCATGGRLKTDLPSSCEVPESSDDGGCGGL
jgi:hypothetical protein